jgi:hypothetical protein
MTSNDVDDDLVLEALGQLRTQDVDTRRAHRLHVRCRAALAAEKRAAYAAAAADSARWTLIAGPALLAAWCAVYVIEIVRLAGGIYRL